MNKRTFGILTAILIIVVAGGYLAYRQYSMRSWNGNVLPVIQDDIVGADSDEHGCKGSAGYSWCEAKQTCLRTWEEPCEAGEETGTDPAEIVSAITEQLVAKHGEDARSLTVEVRTIEGRHAVGSAHETGLGGGMWFAAYSDGSWKLVWDGNGIIMCGDIEPYEFPASMIPQCFDEQTEEMIERS